MKPKIIAVILVSIFLFLGIDFCQAGLGISPSQWIEKHALRGSHIEKTFTLSRAEPKEDLYFKAEIDGEIKDWIKIDRGLEFMMPKGKQQFPIIVSIDVPQDAEYRDYQGSIRLKSEPKTKGPGGIGVVLQALIQIELTVSKERFLDWEVLQVAIPQQEEGKPLNIILKIWNRGNVEARPTKLTADFWDKYKAKKLESKEITDLTAIKAIAPFSEGEIMLSLPVKFKPEQYWADIKVYRGEELLKSENIFFEIVKAAGLAKKELSAGTEPIVNKGFTRFYLYIGFGLIILVLLIFLIFKKRKKLS